MDIIEEAQNSGILFYRAANHDRSLLNIIGVKDQTKSAFRSIPLQLYFNDVNAFGSSVSRAMREIIDELKEEDAGEEEM